MSQSLWLKLNFIISADNMLKLSLSKPLIKGRKVPIKEDPCQRSMDMLSQRCKLWLQEKFQIKDPVFIDDNSYFLGGFPDHEIVDIVFFGSHLEKFLRSGNWNQKQYRFWVLSTSVRKMFVEVYGFDKNQISLIPRYQLFPVKEIQEKTDHLFMEQQAAIDFVYSGRLSPTKNIELIITSYALFKENLSLPSKLYLIGKFDNEVLPGAKEINQPYQLALTDLVKQLNIEQDVLFLDAKSPDNWIKHEKFKNPILINFSTYVHEDFGVSVAQAQSAGWPCMISQWGGHLDLSGIKFMPLPYELFQNYHPFFLIGYAKRIAQYISDNFNFHSIKRDQAQTDLPKVVSLELIDNLRRKFNKKFGPEISLVEEYRHYDFFKTAKGYDYKILLAKYFGKKSDSSQIYTIIFDSSLEFDFINSIISGLQSCGIVDIIQLKELPKLLETERIKKSGEIIILGSDLIIEKAIQHSLIRYGIAQEKIITKKDLLKDPKVVAMLKLIKDHQWLGLRTL